MIIHYRIKNKAALTFESLLLYRLYHPLITTIELTEWHQLSYERVSAVKPTNVVLYNGDKSYIFTEIDVRVLPPSLTFLVLTYQYIGDTGATVIGTLLQENTLKKLNLSTNNISTIGAKTLAAALHYNTSVQELNLSDNEIKADGAKAVMIALQHNTSLQQLDLSGNDLGDDGAQALATALRHNALLQRLDLRTNNIRDEGAKIIAAALKHNTSLQQLDLRDNAMYAGYGAACLYQAITRNGCLCVDMYLDDDRFSPDVEAIASLDNINNIYASLQRLALQPGTVF